MASWKQQAAVLVAAGAFLAPGLARADAAELFYERAVMTAANQACNLFAPDISAALAAAKAQARGAALRSGADAAALEAIETRANSTVRTAGCASPDIALTAARVRAAFSGYAQMASMRYPGDEAAWFAERPADDGVAHWRLSQRVRFGWDVMLFGLAGRGVGRPLMAVAEFADGAQPYGARLVFRDTTATLAPYLETRDADIRGVIPLEDRLPPRSATKIYAAEAMSPAGRDLRGPDMQSAWAFRFPAAAVADLADLDPREAVAVEFLFAGDGGDAVRTAYVEVGDFAAGEAFQDLAQR